MTEAILSYLSHPEIWDPPKHGVSLETLLTQFARRNLANKRRADQRRQVRETDYAELSQKISVELGSSAENIDIESTITERTIEWERILDDPMDRKIFELFLDGERRTKEFAQVLGLSELPLEMQQHEVKRAKDRVLKKVRSKQKRSKFPSADL